MVGEIKNYVLQIKFYVKELTNIFIEITMMILKNIQFIVLKKIAKH